jgi:hypothetical protein
MGGRTRRLLAGVVTSAAVLVGTVGLAAPARAATGPDLTFTAAHVQGGPYTTDDVIYYTFSVINHGNAVAQQVRIDVVINGGVGPGTSSVFDMQPNCTTKIRGTGASKVTSLSCPIQGLAPGQQASLTPRFTVDTPGSYVRTATVLMSYGKDADPTNNSTSVSIDVGAGTGTPPPPSKTPFQLWLQNAQIGWNQFLCLLKHIHC